MSTLRYNDKEMRLSFWMYCAIFLMYLLLRCLAWQSTVLLEDNDSVYLMNQMKVFRSLNLASIMDMNPDSTPIYPILGALCSLPGWDIEIAARVASLLSSALLFLAILLIGKRVTRPHSIAMGLLIITLSPVLIRLSYSVLTEPIYIALCYLGLWFYLVQHREPTLWQGTLLGALFGLCFLARTEGIFYVVVIPAIHVCVYAFAKHKRYSIGKLIAWICLYIIAFSIVAAPQIWRVSNKMGQLAINGRQVWTIILKNPDGKPYAQKIKGLDYSPQEINLHYLQSHPEATAKMTAEADIKSFIRIFMQNFDELYQKSLGILLGPLVIILFALGLLHLFQEGMQSESFIICVFLATALVAPLVHDVDLRHIAIIAPLIMLLAGKGIVYIAKIIAESRIGKVCNATSISYVLVLFIMIANILPLKHLFFNQPLYKFEYDPKAIKKVAAIIKEHAISHNLQNPVVMARMGYLAFYTGFNGKPMPYADYEAFVQYCKLNKMDFVFLEHRLIKDYPFFKEISRIKNSDDFLLIHEDTDNYDKPMELYRFIHNYKR